MTQALPNSGPNGLPVPGGSDDPRTRWLLEHQHWLKLLARIEVDSRFAGKFSASDAVQQTLMEAWRDWEQFKGSDEQQRKAWLRQILAHQLAHLARHYAGTQKRDVRREQIAASLDQSSLRLDQLAARDQTSPSGLLAAREQSLELARVLSELPDDYRTVIVLRNLEDLPHEEVARRMHRSVGAVRMLWLRAMAELRSRVQSLESPTS
jgi:RNA polymerase sigma-70 factor (ECF subfamily)